MAIKKKTEAIVEVKEESTVAEAVKKPVAKKEEPKESVMIQYGANEVVMKDVVAAAVNAYKASHQGIEIKTVDVYVKPEENAAYYVVNGDDSEGNNKINLF